jgi:CheY-like chemotaxis protein
MGDSVGKKILVVEDDQFYSSIFQKKLTLEGYQVTLAADGEQCLKAARELTFDLILLDMVMPVKDGLQTLKELKADEALQKIPVIILSNLGQESDVEDTKNLGAIDFIVKSNMSVQQMVEKVGKYL